jgi:hypothetical protein
MEVYEQGQTHSSYTLNFAFQHEVEEKFALLLPEHPFAKKWYHKIFCFVSFEMELDGGVQGSIPGGANDSLFLASSSGVRNACRSLFS